MAEPIRRFNQHVAVTRCDEGLSNDFWAEYCTPEKICNALKIIFARHPGKKIYIGVSYHPCGRFTGDYSNTDPLPEKFHFPHIATLQNAININEVAHRLMYELMYVICYTQDYKEIMEMERSAIDCARSIDAQRVANDPNSHGGEGIRSGMDYYFLYACVSKAINS